MTTTIGGSEDRAHSILRDVVHDVARQREPYAHHLVEPSRWDRQVPSHPVVGQDRIVLLQSNQSHTTVPLLQGTYESNSGGQAQVSKAAVTMQQHLPKQCVHFQARCHDGCIVNQVDVVEAISIDEPFPAYREQLLVQEVMLQFEGIHSVALEDRIA